MKGAESGIGKSSRVGEETFYRTNEALSNVISHIST